MASYGDIVEINGEFFEFTPVGYMPVKGREGMLTKPAPTTKQTVPVGTPTTDPTKTQPGETGPFDPNAPVPTPVPAPAPAPAPQQTGPIGIPSSDPTKRQAGETGPIGFNDNAVEEVETAPTDTPTTAPVRQEEEAIYPYMYSTRDLGSGAQRESWQDQQVNFLTQSQLQIEFNENSDLKRTFGDFNNYLSYMDGMLALSEEHPEIAWWDIGRLDSTTGETYDAASDPSSYYYGMEEEDMRSGSTALIDANQNRTNEIRAALEAMNALPGYQQLLQDHNVDPVSQNSDGDVFHFNGLNSAEIYETDDSATPYIKAAIGLAISLMSSGALAQSGLGAVSSSVASSTITQLITTGSIDPEKLLTSVATAGIGQAISDFVGPALQEALPGINLSELTGIEAVDDALRAMTNSVIQQGLINGDVDINQVFTAGLFTTLDDVVDFFFNDTAKEQTMEFWNSAQDSVREDLNAQLSDQFGATVGDLVSAMDAETASYFANLTADLTEQLTDEGAWGVTTDFGLPDTPTATQYVEESLRGTALDPATYDNLTDDAARRYMEQAGFSDDEIENYLGLREPPEVPSGLLEWSNTGMMADPDMPFSINVRPDTNEYFIVDPNGNYKAISEADAQALMAFEDANDWQGFADYLEQQGIGGTDDVAGGGIVFGGFTEDGRPILEGVDTSDWLTSTDSQPRFVDVEFVDEPFESTIPEPEIPEETIDTTEELPEVTPEPPPEPEQPPVPTEQQPTEGQEGETGVVREIFPEYFPEPAPAPAPTPAPAPQQPTMPSQPAPTAAYNAQSACSYCSSYRSKQDS
jgi:hypothetical protein